MARTRTGFLLSVASQVESSLVVSAAAAGATEDDEYTIAKNVATGQSHFIDGVKKRYGISLTTQSSWCNVMKRMRNEAFISLSMNGKESVETVKKIKVIPKGSVVIKSVKDEINAICKQGGGTPASECLMNIDVRNTFKMCGLAVPSEYDPAVGGPVRAPSVSLKHDVNHNTDLSIIADDNSTDEGLVTRQIYRPEYVEGVVHPKGNKSWSNRPLDGEFRDFDPKGRWRILLAVSVNSHRHFHVYGGGDLSIGLLYGKTSGTKETSSETSSVANTDSRRISPDGATEYILVGCNADLWSPTVRKMEKKDARVNGEDLEKLFAKKPLAAAQSESRNRIANLLSWNRIGGQGGPTASSQGHPVCYYDADRRFNWAFFAEDIKLNGPTKSLLKRSQKKNKSGLGQTHLGKLMFYNTFSKDTIPSDAVYSEKELKRFLLDSAQKREVTAPLPDKRKFIDMIAYVNHYNIKAITVLNTRTTTLQIAKQIRQKFFEKFNRQIPLLFIDRRTNTVIELVQGSGVDATTAVNGVSGYRASILDSSRTPAGSSTLGGSTTGVLKTDVSYTGLSSVSPVIPNGKAGAKNPRTTRNGHGTAVQQQGNSTGAATTVTLSFIPMVAFMVVQFS